MIRVQNIRVLLYTLLLLLGLVASSSSTAQKTNEFNFSHYSTSNGLLSNQVNSVVQDEEGYIWAGTTDGLLRFDGTRYKSFRTRLNDAGSLPSNPVKEILLDKQKNLWLLMADGNVGIFDRKTFRYTGMSVEADQSRKAAADKDLIIDEFDNVILLLRGYAVLTWNKDASQFSPRYNPFAIPRQWGITDLVQQPRSQKYWLTLQNGGIAIYNKSTRQFSYAGNNADKEPIVERLAGRKVFHPYFDKRGRVWYVTWGSGGFPYLSCYFPPADKHIVENVEFTYLKNYYELKGFFEQRDGTIWVRGLGVFAKYIEREKQFEMVSNGYRHERSIVYELVTALLEDREKNIWVATNNNGLYMFNPGLEHFTNLRHVSRITGKDGRGSVMSAIPTRWGTTLIGTWGDGLYEVDRNFNYIPLNIKGIDKRGGPSVWSMFASADSNTIWMSAQPGFYQIDQANRSAKYYNPAILQNRTVRQIAEDRYGNVWLGMQSIGLFRCPQVKKQADIANCIQAFPLVPIVQINKILPDSKGYVWVATSIHGLYVIDAKTDKLIWHFSDTSRNAQRLPETGVSSVLEYSDSIMLITTGTRVIKFNRLLNRATAIGRADFISGYIAAIEKDDAGYVWLTTSNGLYRINMQKNIFIGFNRGDGIHNDNFILSASAKLPDGRLFFGSTDQLIVFSPKKINLSPPVADVRITDFKVMNQSLVVDSIMSLEDVELGYKQNSLVIEFSALNFKAGALIRYRLNPIDKEWKTADKNNEAVYSYLPPGRYTFSMVSIDEEGNEAARSKDLSIHVKPPFWKTGWFVALLALAGGGLLFRWDKERMQRKEAIQSMRISIARNLHQEVNTALSNINILSEMAKLKADSEPQKSKEFIEQIHNKSHTMMIAMDDMLWSLEPENDSMQKTVARMQEYIDAMNSRHGTNISMHVDQKVNSLELDMQFRHQAFILFKDSIAMLVRARATNCRINVALDKANLAYTLRFDNDCCEMQALNNLLQSRELGARLNAIKATSKIDVHKSNSVIEMRVPLA